MTPDEEKRCEEVLAAVFSGLHNCPKITKTPYYWSANAYGGLSTHDFDKLTLLVFAAHDQGIRVEVGHSGPRMVKLLLHPRRCRAGSITARHPTLEAKLKQWRDCGRVSVELPDVDPEKSDLPKTQPGPEQSGAPVLDNPEAAAPVCAHCQGSGWVGFSACHVCSNPNERTE